MVQTSKRKSKRKRKLTLEERYREIMSTVPKLKGKYLEGEITDVEVKSKLLQRRLKNKANQDLQHSVWDLDTQIFIHKYYPWSYKDYIPTLILQGWYSEKKAKKVYKKIFGPHALDHIKFISGKRALERNFSVGISLYINNHWQYIPSKTGLLALSKFGNKKVFTSFIQGTNTHQKRKELDDSLTYFQNGSSGEINYQDRKIKEARLSKRKAADNKAKNRYYIFPPGYDL